MRKKPESLEVLVKKYLIEEGDMVWAEGQKCVVSQVLSAGNIQKQRKAYIACNPVSPHGGIRKNTTIHCGYNWERL